MIAKHVFYEGRVQGVGFRYTARRIAEGYDVTGWVRNLPDGRVEMKVQASEEAELEAFLREIAVESPLAGHIRAVSENAIPPLDGVRGFTIATGGAN